ncbi:MAG: HNH/ENDO VII family nuclease [Lachnospiraceae bacterium]|nr:HNH/ENDO VII family nuclease [Lachnospiraceae bacterium]
MLKKILEINNKMMKRTIALLLACTLTICGCSQTTVEPVNTLETENYNQEETQDEAYSSEEIDLDEGLSELATEIPIEEQGDPSEYEYEVSFNGLDDEELLQYVEDNLYAEIIKQMDSSDYYVENVSAVYVSKEYLEEVSYNSKSNIFFGYSLEDIEEVYGDSKYVFTLGDNGETIVSPFEDYDDTYDQIIKNVAIGTGVILVCVTVSAVTAGAGAPAVSLIFAASAKTGTVMALSSGTLSGVVAGTVKGFETGDMSEAFKAGSLAASESFKWGAITGVITGGASETVKYAKAMKALKGAELNLTMQEAAAMQMQTGYPIKTIQEFHSMEEVKVFQEVGLKSVIVNGKPALVRKDIDLNLVDEYGRTNLMRMKNGLSPLDSVGNSYELHHIGQTSDATLAILTRNEHDNAFLHGFKQISEIDRTAFATQRSQFWKTMANLLESGAIR